MFKLCLRTNELRLGGDAATGNSSPPGKRCKVAEHGRCTRGHGPDSTKDPSRKGCGQPAARRGSKVDGELAGHGVCLDTESNTHMATLRCHLCRLPAQSYPAEPLNNRPQCEQARGYPSLPGELTGWQTHRVAQCNVWPFLRCISPWGWKAVLLERSMPSHSFSSVLPRMSEGQASASDLLYAGPGEPSWEAPSSGRQMCDLRAPHHGSLVPPIFPEHLLCSRHRSEMEGQQ